MLKMRGVPRALLQYELMPDKCGSDPGKTSRARKGQGVSNVDLQSGTAQSSVLSLIIIWLPLLSAQDSTKHVLLEAIDVRRAAI